MGADQVLQTILFCLVLGSYYTLIASGFTLVFGISRIFNFAHGELYMFGGFFLYYLVGLWHVNYVLASIACGVAVGLLGLLLEKLFYRPVRAHINATFMVAVGLLLILSNLALVLFGPLIKKVPSAFSGTLHISATVSLSWERIAVIGGCAVVMFALHLFISHTRYGIALRAVAQDPDTASLMGMSVERFRALAFFAGSALAGIAAAIVIPVFYVDPFVGGNVMLRAMVVVILGGLGSIPGAVAGGFVLGFIDGVGLTLFGYPAYVIGWVIVIVLMLLRPLGLMGKELR
jgi:branched-chain amino acid transport system permease protein